MTRAVAETIDTVVLAGGYGTRVKSVLGDTPKALAQIDGVPFLDLLLHWLGAQGLRHIVLCLGQGSDSIEQHLEATDLGALSVETIVEAVPLGTGGALRHALPRLTSDPVLVMNGDTVLDLDLPFFIGQHASSGASVSVLCVPVDDCARYGTVALDERGWIRGFSEKGAHHTGPGLVSGGLYLFSQQALRLLDQEEASSLEIDFLQARDVVDMRGIVDPKASFYDIGTPDSLAGISEALPSSWRQILSERQA